MIKRLTLIIFLAAFTGYGFVAGIGEESLTDDTVAPTDYGIDASVEGYWRMNIDSASETDRSGNGVTLAEAGGTMERSTTVPSGFSGYSRTFVLTDTEGLSVDDATLEFNGNQDLTVFVRFKMASDHSGVLIGQYLTTGDERNHMLMTRAAASDDALASYVSANGIAFTKGIGATGLDTNWHSGAMVFNYDAGGSTVTTYLDGSEDTNTGVNPEDHTGGLFASDAWFGLGAQFSATGAYNASGFDGLIYEAGIWSRTFSEAEISEMHTNGIDGDKGAND